MRKSYTLLINVKLDDNFCKSIYVQPSFFFTSRNRTIRPKFDQVEYRSNDDLTCVKLRSNFLAHLGCESSQIRKENSIIITLPFDLKLTRLNLGLIVASN